MGWNYLSIPKLQLCNLWSLVMDKLFHPTLYWTCDHLSILGLKFIHVSEKSPWYINQSRLVFCIIYHIVINSPQKSSDIFKCSFTKNLRSAMCIDGDIYIPFVYLFMHFGPDELFMRLFKWSVLWCQFFSLLRNSEINIKITLLWEH